VKQEVKELIEEAEKAMEGAKLVQGQALQIDVLPTDGMSEELKAQMGKRKGTKLFEASTEDGPLMAMNVSAACQADDEGAEKVIRFLEEMAMRDEIKGTLAPLSSIRLYIQTPSDPKRMVFAFVMVSPENYHKYNDGVKLQ
jgi:hypothetical protein